MLARPTFPLTQTRQVDLGTYIVKDANADIVAHLFVAPDPDNKEGTIEYWCLLPAFVRPGRDSAASQNVELHIEYVGETEVLSDRDAELVAAERFPEARVIRATCAPLPR